MGLIFFIFYQCNTSHLGVIVMKKKKNNRNWRNVEKQSYRIVRCSMQNQPMFESEICDQFNSRVKENDQNNCKNCIHAF
jgi:hypothetical protein